MFQLLVGAMVGAADAGLGMTAAWGDISFSHFKGSGQATSSTTVFTSGGSREILVTHDISVGSLKVRINGGTYVNVPSGYTFNVTTGNTVEFYYTCFWEDESATVTVYDNTIAASVDTFTCDFTFTG